MKVRWKIHLFRETYKVLDLQSACMRLLGSRTLGSRTPQVLRSRALGNRVRSLTESAITSYVKKKCDCLMVGETTASTAARPNKTIWLFWWQGFENAPETVRIARNSLQAHLQPDEAIVFLDKTNFCQYVDIPASLISRIDNQEMAMSHLSDILRFSLLFKYGGLWLDAGMLIKAPISFMFGYRIASLSYPGDGLYRSRGRWIGSIFSGFPGEIFFKQMRESLMRVHLGSGYSVEYLIMDYVIDALVERDRNLSKIFSEFPSINYSTNDLQAAILSRCRHRDDCINGPVHRLSWRFDRENQEFFA
jgi:hypothetical protein